MYSTTSSLRSPSSTRCTSAIAEQQIIRLDYKSQTRLVHPYKLLNHRGCWYLIATQDDEIKTF
ncbi:WYL domain-containing protein [Moraxella catarrhalis]|uniref:WYL domain-containing protein n=1 Tax=Moraxella catarrhalis TaxID=480 RepID=UPI0007F43B17|nr:WYL domain-containing protein [Moraxella catarrhalis]OAU99887.1 hypothetical protein AO385_1310 [Moraxella catarrhalis]